MGKDMHLSDVIGAIYDAAVDQRAWPNALQASCRFLRARSAHIWIQDCGSGRWQLPFAHGIDEPFAQLALESAMVRSNPMSRPGWTASIGQAQLGSALAVKAGVSEHQYLASRFFQEWVEPQQLGEAVHATLEKTDTTLVRIVCAFEEPKWRTGTQTLDLVQSLVPHWRRALLVSKLLESYETRVIEYSNALDGLAAAVFFTDSAGFVVYANRAAEQLLSTDTIVKGNRGLLRFADPRANRQWLTLLQSATQDGRAVYDSLLLQRPAGGHLIGHAVPISSTFKSGLNKVPRATVALFLKEARLHGRASAEVLAALHDLTPAEVRVLLAVIDAGGVRDVARTLHLSASTVRTHLRHIYSKTNTSRQADLVRLVASYSSPLTA